MCSDVPAERAREVIFGYTCANDVTARDLQAKDGQWTRAKGFDTFCPLGPWIETELDPADLELTTRLNGEVRQQSRTSLLVHHVPALVAFVSQVMTLLPGDVLLTGTPGGIGPMDKGDEVSVTIEGIGTLSNPVCRSATERLACSGWRWRLLRLDCSGAPSPRGLVPVGYGVIGSPTGSGPVSLGSSPGTPATSVR